MRAFTLIEVLIAVIILFLAAGAFLSLGSNSYRLFELYKKRNDFLLSSSLVFTENRGGRLDEVVRDFDIKDDKVLRLLRSKKIELKSEIDLKTEFENKKITVKKLKAFDKENMAKIYGVEVR